MAIAYTIAAIILPALLLATIIYVWWKNRQASAGAVRRADEGARKLYHDQTDTSDTTPRDPEDSV